MLDAVQVAASTQAPGRQISGCDTAIGNHGRDLPAAGRSHRPAMAAAGRDRGAGDPRTDDQKISFVHARPVLRYARDLWLRDRITQSLIFLFSQISFYKQQFIELYRPADAAWRAQVVGVGSPVRTRTQSRSALSRTRVCRKIRCPRVRRAPRSEFVRKTHPARQSKENPSLIRARRFVPPGSRPQVRPAASDAGKQWRQVDRQP